MTDLFGNEPMRALSWKEPYASLMLHGKVETRRWFTNYRGLVLMCATLTPYRFDIVNNQISGAKQTNRIWETLGFEKAIPDQYNGFAFAVGRLRLARPMYPCDENNCFVQFHPDLYCHHYEDVRPIEPIPWKGKQGWATVPDEIRKKIKYL